MIYPLGKDLQPWVDFLSLPINDNDIIIVVRNSDLSKPFAVRWGDLRSALVVTGAISVSDEGTVVVNQAANINFTGAGVTVTASGNTATVNIPGGGGTAILLQTDSVTNPVQNILNLVPGNNMVITDDGLGNITFDATGGGGTYTVNNGLTENPANNFQLGGTLVQNTTVTAGSFSMIFTSARTTSFATMYINNTNTGLGLEVFSQNYIPLRVLTEPSSTNTIVETFIGRRRSTGLPSNGIGQSWVFQNQVASSSIATSNELISEWTDVTPATHTSKFRITGKFNAILQDLFTLNGNGSSILNRYGLGTFTGTLAYALGVDATGNVIEFTPGGGGGGGTVTSVALAVPAPTNPAFTVSGSPVTTSGTLTIAAAGTTGQYIRGDGSLANFPTTGGGGSSVSYYLNGSVNQGTFGGSTYYEMSKTPVLGGGTTFTRLNSAGNGLIAQFITDAGDPNLLAIPAGNWNLELFFRASSGGGSPSYYVELYKYDTIGLTFTLIATDVLTPEDITNGTVLDAYYTALAVPQTTLALTDRIALRIFVNTSGRTIELHTENGHLCQIITTFTTGITALNGLTEQVQTFATGTSGTDFGISSSGSIHTFNLPTASAVNRGALSSADWTTFNNKGNGTVTSVGLSMPSAFNVANSPVTGAGTLTVTGAGTISQYVRGDGTLQTNNGSFGVTVDGIIGIVQVGTTGYVVMPYDGTITSWVLTANASGTVSFDITKASSGVIPTVSIIGGGGVYPTLSSQQILTGSTLTGWTTTFSAGDVFGFSVRSSPAPATIKNVTLTIRVTRS
jgi:hypothetical protein